MHCNLLKIILTFCTGNIEDWSLVLDTNVLGLAIATREAIKSMQENNIDGHIININSTAGHQVPSIPYNNVYPASKFAVTGLTETLRKELITLGSKIKVSVNILCFWKYKLGIWRLKGHLTSYFFRASVQDV